MPRKYARAGYSKRKKKVLPYGIYQVAKSASRVQQFNKQLADIAAAEALLAGANPVATQNRNTRREAALLAGKGMYTGAGAYGIRKTLGAFAKRNHLGQRALDYAIGGRGMYTGMGDYAPDTNSLISKSSMEVVPLFQEETDSGILISKREYVSEIFGPALKEGNPVPFTVQSFPINPGLEKTFPWLSQIAQNYAEYEIEQLIFTFKSTTTESTNSTNGQVGTIIMVTNYNSAEPNFSDKSTAQQYEASKSCRLTESMQHGVECDPEKRSGSEGLYIRSNPVVTGQDLKTYDHGNFQIAVANPSAVYANVSLGELWVTYTVRLRKSKFFTALGLGITKDIFVSNGGETGTLPFGPLPATAPFIPTNLLRGQQNNLGCRLTCSAAGLMTVTLPAAFRGNLKLMFSTEGATQVASVYTPPVTTGNVTPVSDLYGAGTNVDSPSYFVYCNNSNNQVATFHIKTDIATNGIDNTFSWNFNLVSGTVTQTYLDISEYNAGFSGKATNTSDSDAPVLVNSSGTVVVV